SQLTTVNRKNFWLQLTISYQNHAYIRMHMHMHLHVILLTTIARQDCRCHLCVTGKPLQHDSSGLRIGALPAGTRVAATLNFKKRASPPLASASSPWFPKRRRYFL